MRSKPIAAARSAALLAVTAAIAAAGCGPTSTSPSAAPSSLGPTGPAQAAIGPPTNWLTYHHDNARSGTVGGLPAAGRLSVRWSRRLDGAVYGQPLVLGNLVIAATENNSIYGLNRGSGRVLWRKHLAAPLPGSQQPCGDIDPLGITSTPVYDPATRLVYVVAQIGRTGHLLAALIPATGRVRFTRRVPSPDRHPYDDQQRSALTAANGRIYVAFGGHDGDCGPYNGSVVGIPASGIGRAVSYRVPTTLHAGIWAPGGPVIGPHGTVYVSVGNGADRAPFDDSDSVTALTPGLRRIGVFAPVNWIADNRADLDLGSMDAALIGGKLILAVGKRGTGYLLRAGHLGGIGGEIRELGVCSAFGGAAVVRSSVYVPCDSGLAAVAVPPARLRVLWRGPPAATGSPVAGGGAIWVTDVSAGLLYELNPATGRVRHTIGLGSALPHFESPSLSGRLILVGTMGGVVAIAGA